MTYEITKGVPEPDLKNWLKQAHKKYGRYNDKYINYSNADIAPIVMCTILYGDSILLVKRGQGLADAEGYWSTINGFIDEIKPVKQIAKQEIKEELGINIAESQIKVAESYTLKNPKEKRAYIVFSCLATLKNKPEIKLDYEHTDSAWIKREELESYEILEDLVYAVDRALALRDERL